MEGLGDPGDAEFVPGDVIVGYEEGASVQSLATLDVEGADLEMVRALSPIAAGVLRDPSLSEDETLAVVAELAARPGVRYAHPNYLYTAAATPNDPIYLDGRQWHYDAIGLPEAWDVTQGSDGINVGIVDSGIVYLEGEPSVSHPDLAGKVHPGYDFVSDVRSSGDGNGRDPLPYDWSPDSSHGTHVAGTVAAATDNGRGVAGVDWNARIVPVRVMGANGFGNIVDIVDGTLWAAGLSVSGVPDNENPAHVLNLSLGGGPACPGLSQDAFDAIRSASPNQAVVVVAAGNEAQDARNVSPASCRNVITVGATGYDDTRAPYSNYGARIDVMAPGGDVSRDLDRNGFPDGVMSTDFGPGRTAEGYEYSQGTSMAAPHVAGVVSLMKGLDPELSFDEALFALTGTAEPLAPGACAPYADAACGAGLVNAPSALRAVRDGAIPTPEVGTLSFEPATIDLGAFDGVRAVTLRNGGSTALTWEARRFFASPDNPADLLDFTIEMDRLQGQVPAGGTQRVQLSVNRNLVTVPGYYEFAVEFVANGEAVFLPGSFLTSDASAPTLTGPMVVAAFLDTGGDEPEVSGSQEDPGVLTRYRFDVKPGDNTVIAWSDENGNVEIDEGDFLGTYPEIVPVGEGEVRTSIDLTLDPVVPTGVVGAAQGSPTDALKHVLEEMRSRD
ncbi:MAG: S8 family peptidase [Trueperaceae bacterium]|nr:S8 family peptidase [Trueperaceae bacterium]